MKDAGNHVAEPPTLRRRPSLRLRLSGWTIGVFTVTLAAFTLGGIVEERQQILGNEEEQARAFLEHIAQMPAFNGLGTSGGAAPQLASIRVLLRAAGGDLEMAPASPSESRRETTGNAELTGLLATRRVSLADGTFELRYRKDPERFRRIAARSVAIHVLHGVLALAALVAGTEWILRRKLIAPLATISHQVEHMRRGGGWVTILPRTDVELERLVAAVGDLGPGLEVQVHQWIDAERRAAAALCLSAVRSQTREPLRGVRAQASDLQARDLVSPAGKAKLRALVAETDRLAKALMAVDPLDLPPAIWSSPTLPPLPNATENPISNRPKDPDFGEERKTS